MKPTGGQADNDITNGNRLTHNNFFLLDHTDYETNQVKVLRSSIQPSHFTSLAANKGTADLTAGLSQPPNNSLHLFRHHPTHANIVQKEERLSATGKYIVDAVVDDIDTDGIIFAEGLGNLGLGTDLVITGYQHRLLVTLELKEPAEEADTAQYLGTEGRAGMLSNQLFCFVSSVNINAGSSVGLLNLLTPLIKISPAVDAAKRLALSRHHNGYSSYKVKRPLVQRHVPYTLLPKLLCPQKPGLYHPCP